MQQEEADFESEDDCKIPLIVFSPPNHAEVNKIFQVKDKTVVQGRGGGGEGGNYIVFHLSFLTRPTPPASMTLHSNGQEPRVACAN